MRRRRRICRHSRPPISEHVGVLQEQQGGGGGGHPVVHAPSAAIRSVQPSANLDGVRVGHPVPKRKRPKALDLGPRIAARLRLLASGPHPVVGVVLAGVAVLGKVAVRRLVRDVSAHDSAAASAGATRAVGRLHHCAAAGPRRPLRVHPLLFLVRLLLVRLLLVRPLLFRPLLARRLHPPPLVGRVVRDDVSRGWGRLDARNGRGRLVRFDRELDEARVHVLDVQPQDGDHRVRLQALAHLVKGQHGPRTWRSRRLRRRQS